jgi:hypothetical protein
VREGRVDYMPCAGANRYETWGRVAPCEDRVSLVARWPTRLLEALVLAVLVLVVLQF